MKINYLCLFFVLIFFNACIEKYDVELIRDNKVLVVEGLLTDNFQDPDTLKIRYSSYVNNSFYILPIPSLKPTITIVETKKEIPLIEYNSGSFLPPKDFKIRANEQYVLKFTVDGQQYESTPESYTPTPPISKIYEKFNPKSKLSEDGKTYSISNEVFIDFTDSPNQKNYYLWRYTDYETLFYCTTCYRPNIYSSFTQSCSIEIPSFIESDNYYDYECQGECYAIIKSKGINQMTDLVSDGALITSRLVAQIPYYYQGGCLVEVQQMCISPEAYAFYNNLDLQSQKSGGLADTPPAAIIGNIRNLNNSSEKVVGYFGVVNIQKKKIWIDRKETTGKLADILGRPINPEPVGKFALLRPPLAPCKKTAFKTPFKPEGWQ
jgi:Domain of unknown function (DUF4249)